MKSTEFITEDITQRALGIGKEYNMADDLIQFALEVNKNCQEYIKQNPQHSTNNVLYRGIETEDRFSKKRVRLDDRTPTDSGRLEHNMLNKYFTEHFGEPFRNAMFCNGDFRKVTYYGDPHLIYPKGHFTFLWSPDIDDFFNAFDGKPSSMSKGQFVENLLANNEYSTKNLIRAINSGNEIMIRSKEYYAINIHNTIVSKSTFKGLEEIINL